MSDLDQEEIVTTCTPDTTISDVLKAIQKSFAGCIVVVDNDVKKVVGIFAGHDYLMKIAGKDLDIEIELVRDYMTPQPAVICDSHPLAVAIVKMWFGRFRHLVVVNSDGKLKSLISLRDLALHIVYNVETCKTNGHG